MSSSAEQFVKDATFVYFDANGSAIKRGIDFDNPAANGLLGVHQLNVAGASGKVIWLSLTVLLT